MTKEIGPADEVDSGELGAFRARVRDLVVDANDGIIAVAGIGEGFLGAGAPPRTALLAVLSATIAGGIALAGAKFAEVANERDAQQAVIDEEARQLALSPAEELAELTGYYERKGRSSDLAARVADELTRVDPLGAHIEAEHGIDAGGRLRPLVVAVSGGLAFAAGSLLVILAVWASPADWRSLAVVVAAVTALVVTSAVGARWGNVPVRRTVVRTAAIGALALSVSYLAGALFDL